MKRHKDRITASSRRNSTFDWHSSLSEVQSACKTGCPLAFALHCILHNLISRYISINQCVCLCVCGVYVCVHGIYVLCVYGVYSVVLVRVSIAATKHHNQKASWGGKGLFGLHFHIAVHH